MKFLFTPILFSLLAFALYFAGLGAVGFLGPDEPRYAEVARGMLRSGDYVTPRLFGVPWFEKPPLYYWLAALSFRLGVREGTARLPSALFACGFLGFWFWFARRLFGKGTATLGCLLLASSLGWVGFARAAAMDMLLSSTLDAALILLALWFWEKKPLQLFGFYGLLGVATLAKGPVAVALAGLIALGYIATCREWRALKKLLWSPALALFVAVAAPWYLLCLERNGSAFFQEFFITHNWQRLTSSAALGHPQPLWFYVPILAAGLFPWTPLLLLPILEAVRAGLRPVLANRQRAFLFWWVVLPFLFFSLSQNKLPGYLLPVLPPLTLWIAQIVERVGQSVGGSSHGPVQRGPVPGPIPYHVATVTKEPGNGTGRNACPTTFLQKISPWLVGLSALLLVAIPVLCSLLPESLAGGLGQALAAWNTTLLLSEIWAGSVPLLVWLSLVGLILLSFYMLRRRQLLQAAFAVLLGVGLSTLAIAEYLAPSINRLASARSVAERAQSLGIRGADLAVYRIHRNQRLGLSFYMDQALPEWSPEGGTTAVRFVIARQEERLPEARSLILFPGPRLRLWALPASQTRIGSRAADDRREATPKTNIETA